MCRFAVRQPSAAAGKAAEPLKLEAPLDLDSLFEHDNDELDANGERGRAPVAQWREGG